jgi:hypothetical protein
LFIGFPEKTTDGMSLSKFIVPLKSAVEDMKTTQGWKDAWKAASEKRNPDIMANYIVDFVAKRSKIESRLKDELDQPSAKRPRRGLKSKAVSFTFAFFIIAFLMISNVSCRTLRRNSSTRLCAGCVTA